MERLDDNTIDSGFLKVGQGHEIFYETWGTPGQPEVLFFHGGPGYGYTAEDKTLFDPAKCKVTFFDQRGSGASKFSDPFKGNNTANLLRDIELLRESLQIGSAILVGGSWGSTLAVLHAMSSPHLASSLVLRAFFPGNAACINALTDESNALVIPNAFLKFVGNVPRGSRNNMIAYYAKNLRHGTGQKVASLTEAWHGLAMSLGRIPREPHKGPGATRHAAITAYYADNLCFLPDDYIYDHAERLSGLPIAIIHGTRDLLCPIAFAEQFVAELPDATLIAVEAGHSASDEVLFNAMRSAIDSAIEDQRT